MRASSEVSDGPLGPRFVMTQFTVEEFQQFWPRIEKMLDRVPHTWYKWTKEYIYEEIMTNRMQMWGMGPPPKAIFIFITQVGVWPTMKILTIVWAAGEFPKEMMPLLISTLMNFAQLNGCEQFEICGRPGWGPQLKAVGFKHVANVWTQNVASSSLN
jgi:hypothetical protein